MKANLFLLLFFFLYACKSPEQHKKTSGSFTLKGRFAGTKADSLFLSYKDSSGKKVEQSVKITNGSFLFKGFIGSPVYAMIMSNIKIKPDRDPNASNATELFLSPVTMTLSLRENEFDPKITGSKMQDDWERLKKQYEPIFKVKDSLSREMNKLSAAGNTPKNHAAAMILGNKDDQCNILIKRIDYQFIHKNPQSFFSAYLLETYLGTDISLDSIEMFYRPFSAEVKTSIAGKSIYRTIIYRKASAPGSMAPDFIKTDINGEKLSLKSFRGKNYILLDFWASWAVSRQENLHLKQIYQKYHRKGLDVISISWDVRKIDWIDAIKKDSIEMWHNVLEDMTSPNNNDMAYLYNIEGMPPIALILIDKQGKIIGRYSGSTRYDKGTMGYLDKKLMEILGR